MTSGNLEILFNINTVPSNNVTVCLRDADENNTKPSHRTEEDKYVCVVDITLHFDGRRSSCLVRPLKFVFDFYRSERVERTRQEFSRRP
jgi:hypothetical protein